MRYGQWCSMRFPTLVLRGPTFSIATLIVEFSELKPEMRRDEAQFWREFEQARAANPRRAAGCGCGRT